MGKLEDLQDGFIETQKLLEKASSSEREGRKEPAESAGKQQRNSDLRLLTLFHVAGSHSYFRFIILHRPEDFRKSAFFFFSQFLANAQAELCLLKRKIIYWHFGIRLGLHGQSNLPSRTISTGQQQWGRLLQGSLQCHLPLDQDRPLNPQFCSLLTIQQARVLHDQHSICISHCTLTSYIENIS